MTALQVLAIINLLLAFGVDAPTVSKVQIMLQNKAISAIEAPRPTPTPTPTPQFGAVAAPAVPPACVPTLTSRIQRGAGEISTGVDFMFHGTSTLPAGCSLDYATYLQTPTTRYSGRVSDMQNTGAASLIENGFVYRQGWGTGAGVVPSGIFEWGVGDVKTQNYVN